jgi:ubiquinone/menaquinone biosynthesis C-methylase UbiE
MLVARVLEAFLRRYAVGQAADVAPFIRGRRLLDLGAGEGFVGVALRAREPVWVCSVDVGPFRCAPGPYVAYDGRRLPFADRTFDTTLILLVLHHCADPAAVLDEAVRVTRQHLIVVESVYRNRRDRRWLDLLDRRLNRYRHGGAMPAAFAFRRPNEWQALFESRRLRTVETRWLGSWWERLVHHPLLFVLEREPSGAPG